MKAPRNTPAQEEAENHRYVTNRIPWYVHALWIVFWLCAIVYIMSLLVPAFRSEMVIPQ